MLVLSRKPQEVIQIGDDICITILRVKGRTVRVGVEAPTNMRVRRGELPLQDLSQRPADGHRNQSARSDAAGRIDMHCRANTIEPAPSQSTAEKTSATFHRRFVNWPPTLQQRLELIALATDA